jgi:FAD/FMN-containing dehydrogenase
MPDEIVIFVEGPTTADAEVVTDSATTSDPASAGEAVTGPADRVGCALRFHGSREAAEAAFAPLAAQSLWSGSVTSRTYVEIQSDGTLPFGLRHYWKGHFLRELDAPAAAAIATAMRTAPPGSMSFVLLEAMNGRARIEPAGGAAFGQREARWNASAIAIWEDPADDAAQIAWARRTTDGLAISSLSGAGYGNYAPVDETDDRVRAGYGPERYARLRAVKRRYDPDNVFRYNHNIPPADR